MTIKLTSRSDCRAPARRNQPVFKIPADEEDAPKPSIDRFAPIVEMDDGTPRKDHKGADLRDINPGRILTQFDVRTNGIPATSFTLPGNLKLTAGQTYYVAVEAFPSPGQDIVDRDVIAAKFTTAPIEKPSSQSGEFSSVTVLTHSWSLPYFDDEVADDYRQMAMEIAEASDGSRLSVCTSRFPRQRGT